EFDEGGQYSRRAEAALQTVILVERLLQRMEFVGRRRDSLDGEQIVAIGLLREHQAGARGSSIEQDGAGAADTVLAAEMGAGEAERVAHEIGERPAHLDFCLVSLAVDAQRDFSRLAHCLSYCGRPAASSCPVSRS